MDPVTEKQEKLPPAGREISLGRGEVHLWYAEPCLLEDPAAQKACLELLSAEERDQCGRFKHERDQLLYLTAHSLLRRVLSTHGNLPPQEWNFTSGKHGKPDLQDEQAAGGLRFNLSHTRGLAVCAVCRGAEIGVDVESLERRMKPLELAGRYFSALEVECLQTTPADGQATRFLQFWTLKESYIKAVGTGLSMPLASFSMQLADEVPDVRNVSSREPRLCPAVSVCFHAADSSSEAGADWQFAQFALASKYLLALALNRGPVEDFKVFVQSATQDFLLSGNLPANLIGK